MIGRDERLTQVIFPVIKGAEINNQPLQQPGRHIINFFDWPLEKAAFDLIARNPRCLQRAFIV